MKHLEINGIKNKVHSKINKLIITNVNLNKELAEVDEDVKRILDCNSSTIKEVIVE